MTEKSYRLHGAEIEGERVLLRPITPEDTPLIVKWRNTESVRRNFIFRGPFTAEVHTRWMETKVASGEVLQYIIVDKETGESVGSVYFRDVNRENRSAEYGIFIGEEAARGNGLGCWRTTPRRRRATQTAAFAGRGCSGTWCGSTGNTGTCCLWQS